MNNTNQKTYNPLPYAIKIQDAMLDKAFKIAKNKKISQDTLAKAVGVSQSTISRYKRKISPIPADQWITLICYVNSTMFLGFDSIVRAMFVYED